MWRTASKRQDRILDVKQLHKRQRMDELYYQGAEPKRMDKLYYQGGGPKRMDDLCCQGANFLQLTF